MEVLFLKVRSPLSTKTFHPHVGVGVRSNSYVLLPTLIQSSYPFTSFNPSRRNLLCPKCIHYFPSMFPSQSDIRCMSDVRDLRPRLLRNRHPVLLVVVCNVFFVPIATFLKQISPRIPRTHFVDHFLFHLFVNFEMDTFSVNSVVPLCPRWSNPTVHSQTSYLFHLFCFAKKNVLPSSD